MISFLSDASECGSCAHQLMVSVRFYGFFCHDGHFRSSFSMSGDPVTPPRRTLARFQRLGFNASLTTFIFFILMMSGF